MELALALALANATEEVDSDELDLLEDDARGCM
jgi:hypothetical protein